ncbi:translation initiation factor IF-3 [Candidatus Schneideria nysicola]|uniref:translation initiation factor IF-3 n=1 Tax=Candidatus Schneideria nysicola TaxID=1081631 RepID=UPI001CAA693F|nr:translation initiation factor IF-3 [Candidatus Schneideria nysicola]UAJ65799.1 translation initiation factor IF-3 [Candidatus Schneideria nysicola]UAJ66326.1 translation initiation factor IF-3 [Candidatus Schneideria nysicola]
MKGGRRTQLAKSNRINQEIYAKKVRLTGLDGEQIGIFKLSDAIKQAEDIGFDLVEISPNADPPVCRIMDYGKFLYEKSKSIKEQRKKQKTIQIKEIKFRPSTDKGDYQVKLRSLIRFLEEGDKARITIRFRGREVAHQQIGIEMLNRIRDDLSAVSIVESMSNKIEGRQMTMLLSPKKSK